MTLTLFLGWTATFLFTVCYIPQIIKTFETKTVRGLSFWLLFIQFVANMVALWYAVRISQAPLIIKYSLGIGFLVLCMGVYAYVYGRERRNQVR